MRQIAAEWLECKVENLPTKVSYLLPEWGIKGLEQYLSLHRFAVTQRGLFETCEMIPGTRISLRRLSDEGARIRIITHRLFIQYFHRAAVSQTIGWLDNNGIPYSDLCFMQEKDQVGAHIYVEDSPKNVELLRGKNLYTICFGNSTNTHIGAPRAKSWKETYELIHKRLES
jgi:5'(3')-deoxyribonucleotidase